MKNFIKLISIVGALNIITVNSVMITGCSFNTNINKYSKNASLLQWKLSAEDAALVKKYESEIHKSASASSIKEFNDLYDNNKKQAIWNDYDSLQYDLTHTKIGGKSIDVDWVKMYKNAHLSSKQLQEAEQQQLRFYNILAKVYQKDNIMHLIQEVDPVAVSDNTVAWTAFAPNTDSQRMGYGPDFVNTKLIDEQYQAGFWSSDNIISVTTHEYGHALSNFIGLSATDRSSFNSNWNWPESSSNNLNVTNKLISSSVTNTSKQINNRAQYLMDFLAKQTNITNVKQELLFSLVTVDSNYGRSAWSGSRNPNLDDEFFAESLAGWLLTPDNQRDWGWELENSFFLHYLPAVL